MADLTLLDIVTPLVISGACAFVSWIGLKIHSSIQAIQLKLQEAVSALTLDFTTHLANITSDLKNHQTQDEGNFREIRNSLDRIERTIKTQPSSRKLKRPER